MRRIELVRLTDWAIRILVTITFLEFFLAPSEWIFRLVLICFAVVGLWSGLYPEGLLGWAKVAHPSIDENDSSLWWVPRLIGAIFLLFVVALALVHRST